MKLKVVETRIKKFNFEIVDNKALSEEEKVKNGSLSLDFPDVDISDEADNIPLKANMNIELIEDTFSISAEINGTFMVPKNAMKKEIAENITEFSNELLKPLIDKFTIYFGIFSNEVSDVMTLPRLKIDFSD